MNEDEICALTGASRVVEVERIQSLWDGYGELVRARLASAKTETVIVKSVTPPRDAHARKCRSYEVETEFYRRYAPQCDERCRVAALVGARGRWTLVLEDLDAAGFTERRRHVDGVELDACLSWLAAFHARFLGVRPEGLWKIGTYWHLATRLDELASIGDARIRERAPIVDKALGEARFRTIVHGDAKPANFCFTHDGARACAVDFQYTGGGAGIKDVAYLLYGESARTTARALDAYFAHLRGALAEDVDGAALEREWRELFPLADEDFRRFLAGWRK